VDTIFEEMASGLSENKRIELRGFGAFSLRSRKARVARNPKTNHTVAVAERFSLYFRPGKALRHHVNTNLTQATQR